MRVIKVLGSGCARCRKTEAAIRSVVERLGVDAEVVKVEDMAAIIGYGVLATPAVVIDEKLVMSGAVPRPKVIEAWLREE